MIRSESLDQLAAALSAAQGEFEAVDKSAANPFFRSSYAPLPTVVQAATPILNRHGLSVSQLPGFDEQGDTLTTMLLHTSGQFMAGTLRLRPVKDDPQAQGSAITYGRRYSYMAILGLVADEDDDGNAGSAGRPAARKAPSGPAAAKRKAAASKPPTAKPEGENAAPAGTPTHARPVDDASLKTLREKFQSTGHDEEWLRFTLTACGVEDAGQAGEPIGPVMRGLTLEQAISLGEALDRALALKSEGVE